MEAEQTNATDMSGQRRVITVLFADLRRFTSYAERRDPVSLLATVNSYLTIAADSVLHYGGMLDKFMGDAAMALFNAREPQPDHAMRAIKAALYIQERMAFFNSQVAPALQFGIGISTGEAVVGNVGTPTIHNYTALGDTVNVAARLESKAKGGEILLGGETYRLVSHWFAAEPVGLLTVRGRRSKIEGYRLTKLSDYPIK